MKYIWINPVTDRMYDKEQLDAILLHHGYKRIQHTGDWANVGREKYHQEVQKSKKPVMDVRCPKIKELLEERNNDSEITIPDIDPILLHCGAECSKMEQNGEKIITTPCQVLADMGNALGLDKTRFVPWNQFAKSIGMDLRQKDLNCSPIPLGFFDSLNVKTSSISGENEIRCYLEREIPEGIQLIEMLYCKDGCHNGDGMRMDDI